MSTELPGAREGGIPANSCSEILPGKRQKRNERSLGPPRRRLRASRRRTAPCARPRRLGNGWLLLIVLVVVTLVAAPALAGNEPRLVSTYPPDLGEARSDDAGTGITATYDRDLNPHSTIKLTDVNGDEVAGVVELAGPTSETGGKRTIKFKPQPLLTEALSPYEARAKAIPLVPGEPTVTTWTFSIDDTPPAPPVITDPSNGDVRSDHPIVALGTTEPGAFIDIVEDTVTIASDRANQLGEFSVTLPYPREDGVTHTIEAVATDRAGNRSQPSAPVTFIHDSIHETPVIITPAQHEHLNDPNVFVSGTAKAGSTVTIREGGNPVGSTQANAQGEWGTSIFFPQGTHVITAEAFDGINTDGPSAARTFTVDTTPPPTPVIDQPVEGAAISTHDVTVSGTAEPNTKVQIRQGNLLRATLPVDGAGGWSGVIHFSSGTHSITARGEDLAGNLSAPSAPRTFTVDTAAPPPPVITQPEQDEFLDDGNVTVAGTAEANALVRVKEGTVTVGQVNADGAGAWSVVIVFPDGAHLIHAEAQDAAGNVSPPSAAVGFTVDTVAPDAPVITQPTQNEIVETTEVLVGGTGEPGALIEVLEGFNVIGSTTADGASNWTVWISFTPGAHTITARATDLAGNVSPASDARSFTVSVTTDNVPPPPPVITEPAQNQIVGPIVTFGGTAEPASTVKVYLGATVLGSGTAAGSGQWGFAVTMQAGTHSVVATATDPSGNESAPSPMRTFTVDTIRPTVAFTTASGGIFLPGQSVVLQGTAGDNIGVASITVEVFDRVTGIRAALLTATCTGCPGTAVTWEATPSLLPGVYRARAVAKDIAGNTSFPDEISFIAL